MYHFFSSYKVRKKAKIRNRYNQAPHLTQDTNGKVTTSKLDITNEAKNTQNNTLINTKAEYQQDLET